jgi:hypothetical protein
MSNRCKLPWATRQELQNTNLEFLSYKKLEDNTAKVCMCHSRKIVKMCSHGIEGRDSHECSKGGPGIQLLFTQTYWTLDTHSTSRAAHRDRTWSKNMGCEELAAWAECFHIELHLHLGSMGQDLPRVRLFLQATHVRLVFKVGEQVPLFSQAKQQQ